MNSLARIAPIMYADYLAAEKVSNIKHEYRRGEVVAMAGGTPEHAGLAANILAALASGIRGRRCRVFSSDLRVRLVEKDFAVYPDASVVCGKIERARDDDQAITNPIVIVEVLSDSTEVYDRGQKAMCYRSIPSLQEYVLASQKEPHLQAFRRADADVWQRHDARYGGFLELQSIGVSLDVDDIYFNPLSTYP